MFNVFGLRRLRNPSLLDMMCLSSSLSVWFSRRNARRGPGTRKFKNEIAQREENFFKEESNPPIQNPSHVKEHKFNFMKI